MDRPLDFALKARVGVGHCPDVLLGEVFGKHVEQSRLTTMGTARQGAALDLAYGVRLRRADGAESLVTELNRLEGIQEVELRAV